jgi:flagellar secretion chaperone FliS
MNIQQSYREASVRGANPVQLVVRLYEQMIEDMRQVAIAIEQNDIMLRTKRIRHAILVIGHLQSSLDFSKGGKVAQDLNRFYDVLRQNLVQVQFHPSKRGVSQAITDLLAVREAWIEVERAEYPSVLTAPSIISSGPVDPQPGGAYEVACAGATDLREDVRGGIRADEARHLDWNG